MWVFNPETGKITRNKITGEPIPRIQGTAPPCHSCPKCNYTIEQTPEIGRQSDLSAKNKLTLARYYEQLVSPEKIDDVAKRNFGIIHELVSAHDRTTKRLGLFMNKSGN